MNVFGTVKTSGNTREAAERYGVEINRHGKALCPFHNDRHHSTMTAIRACLWTMTTTTATLAASMGT